MAKSKTSYSRESIAYRGYLIKPYLQGGWWIEKGGYIILHYISTQDHAKAEIDRLLCV